MLKMLKEKEISFEYENKIFEKKIRFFLIPLLAQVFLNF